MPPRVRHAAFVSDGPEECETLFRAPLCAREVAAKEERLAEVIQRVGDSVLLARCPKERQALLAVGPRGHVIVLPAGYQIHSVERACDAGRVGELPEDREALLETGRAGRKVPPVPGDVAQVIERV